MLRNGNDWKTKIWKNKKKPNDGQILWARDSWFFYIFKMSLNLHYFWCFDSMKSGERESIHTCLSRSVCLNAYYSQSINIGYSDSRWHKIYQPNKVTQVWQVYDVMSTRTSNAGEKSNGISWNYGSFCLFLCCFLFAYQNNNFFLSYITATVYLLSHMHAWSQSASQSVDINLFCNLFVELSKCQIRVPTLNDWE